jgi:hypothetical protein
MLVNTIMVERTLERHGLWERMNQEDRRALTPLFHTHINPYGVFELDLESPLLLNSGLTPSMESLNFRKVVLPITQNSVNSSSMNIYPSWIHRIPEIIENLAPAGTERIDRQAAERFVRSFDRRATGAKAFAPPYGAECSNWFQLAKTLDTARDDGA